MTTMLSTLLNLSVLIFLSPGLIAIFLLIIVPVFVAAALFNEIIRVFVSVLLWLKYRGGVFLCQNGEDAMWEYRTPGNCRMVVLPLITKRGQLKVDTCIKHFEDRLFSTGAYEKLKRSLTSAYGYVCWKEDKSFDLRSHVRALSDKVEYSEEDLLRLLPELTEDIPSDRPQWEWVLIPKYRDSNGDPKSIIIFRFHHAYMDGMSILMMVDKLSVDFQYVLNPLTFRIPRWKMVLLYLSWFIYGTQGALKIILNRFIRSHWVFKSEFPGESKAFAWSELIDLDFLRQIRVKTGSTVPTIVSQAFVQSCEQVIGVERMPKVTRVLELMAFVPYPHSGPQNRFAAFSYPLHTKLGVPWVERLQRTQENSSGSLAGPEPLMYYYGFRMFGRLPTILYPVFFGGAQGSFCITNAPGAKTQFSVCGVQSEEFGAFPPIFNATGILISSISYKKSLKLCGMADSSMLSADELRAVFKEIPNTISKMIDTASIPVAATKFLPVIPPPCNYSATDSDLSSKSPTPSETASVSLASSSSSADQNQNKSTNKPRRRRVKKRNSRVKI